SHEPVRRTAAVELGQNARQALIRCDRRTLTRGAAKPAEPSTPGGRSENVCVPSTPVAMQEVGFLANPSFTLRSPSAARQPRASRQAPSPSLPVHAGAVTCPAARLCPPAPTLPLMA